MVKAINVYFDEKELKILKKLKGSLSWKDFIIKMGNHCNEYKERGEFQ